MICVYSLFWHHKFLFDGEKSFFYFFKTIETMRKKRKKVFVRFVELLVYELCDETVEGEQQSSMTPSLDWTFLCVVFTLSAHYPYFMSRYVYWEWKEKFIHFTHSHNWAAHERMNRIKRSFHQEKLFPPLAFVFRISESVKPSRKGDTFVIMKMAAKNSHLFIKTSTVKRQRKRKTKEKRGNVNKNQQTMCDLRDVD